MPLDSGVLDERGSSVITIDTTKVTGVLLAGAGWTTIAAGSLTIDALQLGSTAVPPEAEDYGFTCVDDAGAQVTGRISALLATKRTGR